jgi:16S rRNA pseudouridine516 synthase
MQRLDKTLSNAMFGSRKEVTVKIRNGEVSVNEVIIKDPSFKVEPQADKIIVKGVTLNYKEYYHIMLNKPSGVITATEDKRGNKTVLDLIDDKYPKDKLFPVGRLDKDTTGFVLLTTDGQLAHRIMNGKKDILKVYFVTLDEPIKEAFFESFENGVVIDDGYKCKSAKLEVIDPLSCYLTISEGKFHQVKRMFEACGRRVVALKRVKIGGIDLDDTLAIGEYRELTQDEIINLEG